tara:strand:- start:1280 stop:1528 length:249 start_codon:yes stop_codon:yes gene_type:complete
MSVRQGGGGYVLNDPLVTSLDLMFLLANLTLWEAMQFRFPKHIGRKPRMFGPDFLLQKDNHLPFSDTVSHLQAGLSCFPRDR